MTSPETRKHIQILVVDDEPGMCDLLKFELGAEGYQVTALLNSVEARDLIAKKRFDLVISDMKMPRVTGLDLLAHIKKQDPTIEVIISTGYGTVESAVQAMKQGAYDFVLKPFHIDEMKFLVERCLEKRQLKTLVALYESSKAIFSTIRLEQLFEIVMEMISKLLRADEGSLMLLNPSGALEIVASRGLSDEFKRDVNIKIGDRVAGRVAKQKEPLLLIDGLEKYPDFKDVQSNPRIKSSIVCPLMCQEELLGVLSANRTCTDENFTFVDLQSASIVASQVALAVKNAKLYESLKQAYQNLETAQNQLLQSEKLASIGKLVAGVAHEINNPLTSVIGYAQLAAESQGNIKDLPSYLATIIEQAERCSKIVKDLLFFARKKKPEFQAVDLNQIVKASLNGLSLEFERRNVKVAPHYSPKPLEIEADPNLLKQVVSNMLVNAYQALEEASGERKIDVSIALRGERATITMADTGPGIGSEHIGKIFDPFFSTKGVGKGTGLGLSLCYGIIQEHGGDISVESRTGSGTTFVVVLPLRQVKLGGETPQEEAGLKPVISKNFGNKIQKVLMVEDEEAIRRLVMTILSAEGFQFDIAENGEIALQKIRASDYDLILCDYQIPKLNGFELFQSVAKIKPLIAKRFVFISGSTQFMQSREAFFIENHLNYLHKPFTKQELLEKIRCIKNSYTAAEGL